MIRHCAFQTVLDRLNAAINKAQEAALKQGVHVSEIGEAVFYCAPDDRYGHVLQQQLSTWTADWTNDGISDYLEKVFGTVRARILFSHNYDIISGLDFNEQGRPVIQRTHFLQGYGIRWWINSAFIKERP